MMPSPRKDIQHHGRHHSFQSSYEPPNQPHSAKASLQWTVSLVNADALLIVFLGRFLEKRACNFTFKYKLNYTNVKCLLLLHHIYILIKRMFVVLDNILH